MAPLRRLLASIVLLGCSAATEAPGPAPENEAPAEDGLVGCKGKASSSIPASGTYVLTTFGGPSEPQPLACGGHSKGGTWYYAASKQRFGCGAHVRISANGKCVVARTDDYGPDVCVEKAAGMPVMDASPLVGKALFGQSSLGWSDKKKVTVELVDDSTPLGPCKPVPSGTGGSGGSGGADGSGGASSGGTSSGGAPSGGASSSGGTAGSSGAACASDGACNPGGDGSGLICVGGKCVPGCHQSWQCPGNTTCKSGQCK